MRPFSDSTELINNSAALQQRMARDGYLLVRNLLPRQTVLDVHYQLATHVQNAGWLDKNFPAQDCIANPAKACVDPEPEYLQVLQGFNQCYEFYALTACVSRNC